MRDLKGFQLIQFCVLAFVLQWRIIIFKSLPATNKTLLSPSEPTVPLLAKFMSFLSFHLTREAISDRSGISVYGGHAQIWIQGTRTDRPLIVDLSLNPIVPSTLSAHLPYVIVSKYLGLANTDKRIRYPPYPHTLYYWASQGETTLTNAAVFDHRAGTAEAWMVDPIYRMGTSSSPNSCYDFIERVLRLVDIQLGPGTNEQFENSIEYYTSYSGREVQRVPDVATVFVEPAGSMDRVETRVFNVDSRYNPDAPSLVSGKTQCIYSNPLLLAAVDQSHLEGAINGTLSVS